MKIEINSSKQSANLCRTPYEIGFCWLGHSWGRRWPQQLKLSYFYNAFVACCILEKWLYILILNSNWDDFRTVMTIVFELCNFFLYLFSWLKLHPYQIWPWSADSKELISLHLIAVLTHFWAMGSLRELQFYF